MSAELVRARAVAARCGVTRLADITHLDVIGTPVFTAVRPWSRALSVHQGKGESATIAALGALMEASESHFAETFDGPVVHRTFQDLPIAERAPTLGDFAFDRVDAHADDEPIDWVAARTLGDGERFWLPFDLVSLDLSREGDLRLDRSSDGLACHFDARQAALTALLEVIERDAVAEFRASDPWWRTTRCIEPRSIDLAWLHKLKGRLDVCGIAMRLYDAPAVVAMAVTICELSEAGAGGLPRALVFGSACHPDPETALRKAVLEAIQSRLTTIAAVRDDILPDSYTDGVGAPGLALPAPPNLPLLDWNRLTAGLKNVAASAEDIASQLRAKGYPTTALVDVAPAETQVAVVKAFVPGLGSTHRRRRPPCPSV